MSFAGKSFSVAHASGPALTSLHRSLGAGMQKAGIGRSMTLRFTPHITLLYGDRMVTERSIEPVRWIVRDFALVHSLRGHTHVARWPLRT